MNLAVLGSKDSAPMISQVKEYLCPSIGLPVDVMTTDSDNAGAI